MTYTHFSHDFHSYKLLQSGIIILCCNTPYRTFLCSDIILHKALNHNKEQTSSKLMYIFCELICTPFLLCVSLTRKSNSHTNDWTCQRGNAELHISYCCRSEVKLQRCLFCRKSVHLWRKLSLWTMIFWPRERPKSIKSWDR